MIQGFQTAIEIEFVYDPETKKIDVKKTLDAFRRFLDDFDKTHTEVFLILQSNDKAWSKYPGLRSMSVSTLCREILSQLGKSIKKREELGDFETAVKELVTSSNRNLYHYIGRGHRKGIHRKDRYAPGEFEKVLEE